VAVARYYSGGDFIFIVFHHAGSSINSDSNNGKLNY